VKHARYQSHLLKVEVECQTLDDVEEALDENADVLLLDNMAPEMMRAAIKKVREHCYEQDLPDDIKNSPAMEVTFAGMWTEDGMTRSRVLIEASGNITLGNIRAVAETGVDFISVGALTHSAPILPMHMELKAD
jgi:nicotinate-nucleotide pyrophosphorylase (carboxylating)